MGVLIFVIILAISGIYLFIRTVFGRRIEINFTYEKIYGWYNYSILVTESFSERDSFETLSMKIDKVEKELDERIKTYKQIKKYKKKC